jgi:hypothetical protein
MFFNKELNIKWDNELTGYAKSNFSTYRIYSLKGKVRDEIYSYCHTLINNPKIWQNLQLDDLKLQRSFSASDVIDVATNKPI